MSKDNQDQIYETSNFSVERHPQPFVSREEGGHIRIFTRHPERVSDRSKFTPEEAVEFIRLSMVAGQAFLNAMNKQGVPIIWINYEELGNWSFKRNEASIFHLHIFGRVKSAVKQVFPEAVYLPDRDSGFYNDFCPLRDQDMRVICQEIEKLYSSEKYIDHNWELKNEY
jgi:diadenosine tetraphosphate (Ap4A) HIT family hydrolase